MVRDMLWGVPPLRGRMCRPRRRDSRRAEWRYDRGRRPGHGPADRRGWPRADGDMRRCLGEWMHA
eukprot:SAG11_NODE_3958_length_2132_cov_2.261190_2_plen_65_part_00